VNSFKKTAEYVSAISGTLWEMGVNLQKISNLNYSLLTNFVINLANLEAFIEETSQTNLKLFLYPPESNPNLDMSIYAKMINDQTKISYFKAKYSFITSHLFLKVWGVLGSNGDIQNIMPIFLGNRLVRTDNHSISLTLELSSEGIVYAIAIPAISWENKPNSFQIALGIDGEGNKAEARDEERTFVDYDGNFRPVILRFDGLRNDVEFSVFYAAGLQVPREIMVSNQVLWFNATPSDPMKTNKGKKVLRADSEDL